MPQSWLLLIRGGGQLRPICVSTIWVKLISYLLLPKARECLDPHLQGRQFGVGTSQGATAMIMHVKAHLAQFPEHVAVQLDFKNAFCTLHRQTCLEVVAAALTQRGFKRCPICSPDPRTYYPRGKDRLSPLMMVSPRRTP